MIDLMGRLIINYKRRMNDMKSYTEEEIQKALESYSEFHSEKIQNGLSVHVTVNVLNVVGEEEVIGFRLSLDGDGRSHGYDEIIGAFF
jgi:predicted KAP-like P-loop ATPase